MIGALLVLLICTLIGALVGHAFFGLVAGAVVLALVAWLNWYRV
jgi:hypothetical protein